MGSRRARTLWKIEELDAKWSFRPNLDTPLYGRVSQAEVFRGWSIPRVEALYLYSLIRLLRPGVALELGTSFGYSAIWMSAALDAGAGGQLHTCESLPEKSTRAKAMFKRSGTSNVALYECPAIQLCRSWTRPIEFLFLDADPENYGLYWKLLRPTIRPNGLVIVDNAIDRWNRLRSFLKSLSSDPGLDCWTTPVGHGVFHARVRGSASGGK